MDAYNVIELRVTKRSSPGPFGFLLRAENDRAVVSGAAPGGDPVVVGVGYHISAVNSVDVEDLTFDQILRLVDQIPTGQRVSLMLKGPPKRGRLDSQLSVLSYETVEATEQAKMDLLNSLRGRMKVKKGKQGHTIFQESDLSDHDDEEEQLPTRSSHRSSNGFGKTAVRSSKSFTNGTHDSSRQLPRQRNVFRDGRNAIQETEEDTEEDASDVGGGGGLGDRRAAPVSNGGSRSMQASASSSSKRNVRLNVSSDRQPVKPARSASSAGAAKDTSAKPVELVNVADGKTIVDTLHHKSHNRVECDATTCAASLMKSDKPVGIPNRSQDEVLREARDFFKQYFEHIKSLDSAAHRERLADVEQDILSRGSYEFEPAELLFGAKTAWRNAQRCIGRIQWSNLQFFDGRDCDTPKKMFDILVKHIRYATNGGNLRSACTLFRQRMNGPEDDFRIWNAQLVRYAGYKMPDGSVVGDPANVEFTEVCQRLGWQGPGGRFDVLPLVLQANGQDPQCFEIPKDAVLEVDLTHPEYPEFAEMGLRWYALPAVANMFLDIGGQVFPACAFSGWYLQTELARDFCDANRYNLLEDLASVFGFDTSKLSSLWKDQTFLEVNRAVLYSFQQVAKVTISDHHSISESFMTHLQNEQRLRGGCPADWIWIVPPLGGSLLPVFHQEMIEYRLTPSYEYQDPPYKNHVWRNKKMAQPVARQSSTNRSSMQGASAARSNQVPKVQVSSADKVRATVIYASETGKSNKFALIMGDILKKVFEVNVVPADEYDVNSLKDEQLLLMITSTFGNGDPPENGKDFAASLHQLSESAGTGNGNGKGSSSSLAAPKKSGRRWSRTESYIKIEDAVKKPNRRKSQTAEGMAEDSSGLLKNIQFAVFGLGSTSYPHFCAFAHYVDEVLFGLGGKRMMAMQTGDELNGLDQSFKEWSMEVLQVACDAFGISAPAGKSSSSKSNGVTSKTSKSTSGNGGGWSKGKFRLNFKSAPNNEDLRSALSRLHNKKVQVGKLLNRKHLQSPSSDRQTILVQFRSETPVTYIAGDHVAIFAQNDFATVASLLKSLHIDTRSALRPVELQIMGDNDSDSEDSHTDPEEASWKRVERLPLMPLATLFAAFLDISTPPSQTLVEHLGDLASDKSQQKRLRQLGKDSKEYQAWRKFNWPSLLEVLQEFPSVQADAALLLLELPLLQPRYYSVSSSPLTKEQSFDLTVGIVSYKTQDGQGPLHQGLCTTYLNNLPSKSGCLFFVRSAPSFYLPDNPSTPVYLICAGTGIAPFRAFWQHLQQTKVEKANVTLLFGCRDARIDHIYKEEIDLLLRTRIITNFQLAVSRQSGVKKMYVQDTVEAVADRLLPDIKDRNGHIYICGDVKMAHGVSDALREAFVKRGLTADKAKGLLDKLKIGERYHEDIYGTGDS